MNAQLELFYGASTTSEAHIYARFSRDAFAGDWPIFAESSEQIGACPLLPGEVQLQGQLIGPECKFSHTLSARFTFLDRSTPEGLLAEAIVPDPCFWTPELPFLYRARLELVHRGETIGTVQRHIGIRPLGAVGKSLKFDGERFVVRGVRVDRSTDRTAIEQVAAFARESYTAILIPHPTDGVCEFASQQGVLLIADLTDGEVDSAPDCLSILRRLGRWPAVAIVLLNASAPLPDDIQRLAPNLLLAQHFPGGKSFSVAPWAQLAMIDATDPAQFSLAASGCDVPVIAFRPQPQFTTLEASRAACDELQRDLAPVGDFAGYVV